MSDRLLVAPTLAIDKPGAINAALLAVQILATSNPALAQKRKDERDENCKKILDERLE